MKRSRFLAFLFGSASVLSPLAASAETLTSDSWSDLTATIEGSDSERIFQASGDVSATEKRSASRVPSAEVTLNGQGHSLLGNGYAFNQELGTSTVFSVRNWGTIHADGSLSGGWTGFANTAQYGFFQVANSGNTLEISDSVFQDNTIGYTMTLKGGLISNAKNGTVTISNSHFVNNKAASTNVKRNNGLVFFNNGNATISDSSFSGNTVSVWNTSSRGGAIYNEASGSKEMTLIHVNFNNNSSSIGGALYHVGGTLTITGGEWSGNDAAYGQNNSSYGGGAIYSSNNSSVVSIDGTLFRENKGANGGAIWNQNSSATNKFTIKNSTFEGNSASYAGGGAIKGSGGVWQIENCSFIGNSSSSTQNQAGALELGKDARVAIVDSDFIGNTAAGVGVTYGSGGAVLVRSEVVIAAEGKDVTFSGNYVEGDSGRHAISIFSGQVGTSATVTSRSASLYLNAAEGREILFKGNGIVGESYYKQSSSVKPYVTDYVYINSAGKDMDVMTSGTTAAGTSGTVSFVRDEAGNAPAITNVTMTVEGGSVNMEGATINNSSIILAGDSRACIGNTSFGALEGNYAHPYSSFTLADTSSAIIENSTITLGESVIPFTMSATSSLTLSGTLTIALDSRYESLEEIVIDEDFVLQLVQFEDGVTPASTASLVEDTPQGLYVDNMTVVFTYGGEEIAHTAVMDAETLSGTGALTFTPSVPEPTTAALSLLALAGLAARRRRR